MSLFSGRESLGLISKEWIPIADTDVVRREGVPSLSCGQMSNSTIAEPAALSQSAHTIAPSLNNLQTANTSNSAAQSYRACDPRVAGPSMGVQETPACVPKDMENPVESNSRLRTKLKHLRIERDDTLDGLEKCLSELIATQLTLEEREAEIAKQKIELANLHNEVTRLSREVEERTPQFSKMEELFAKRETEALAKKDEALQALRNEMNKLLTSNAELLDSWQTIQRLRQERDAGWQVKLDHGRERFEAELQTHRLKREEAEARVRKPEMVPNTVEVNEKKLRTAEARVETALSEANFQQSKAEACQEELRELRELHAVLSETVQKNSKTGIDPEALEQLNASHAAGLEEARRLSDFFRNNSEQLSRKNREAMAANRSWQECLAVKNREVDEQKSLVLALKMKLADLKSQNRQ